MVFYSDSVDTETSMRNVSGTIALYRYLKLLQNKKYLIISAIIIRSLAKLIKGRRGGVNGHREITMSMAFRFRNHRKLGILRCQPGYSTYDDECIWTAARPSPGILEKGHCDSEFPTRQGPPQD